MANSNGWGDGAANNTIGWGQGANNLVGWGAIYAVSDAGRTDIIGVAANLPVNTVAPVLTLNTDPVQAGGVSTDNGSWTNSPTSFTYQWFKVPETGGVNTAIPGETTNSYNIYLADEDYLVTCQVTAINAAGSSTPEPSDAVYIYNSDYFYNVYNNGYDGSTAQSYLQNRLMLGIVASGAWTKLDYFNVYAIDGQGTALINWKNGFTSAILNGTITWVADQGYTGNGTSGYINTGFDPTIISFNYTLNNASRYFFPYAFGLGGGPFDGIASSTRNSMTIGVSTDNYINQGSAVLPSNFDYDSNIEPKSIHRTNASTVRLFNGVSGLNKSVSSIVVVAENQLIGRSNANYSDHTVAAYAMGASMVAENTAFVAAWTAYINAI